MGQRIAAVDAYIAKKPPFARPILEYLRELVHATCPGATEVMKWSFPCFDYHGPFVSMAAFKQHATFGFWKYQLLTGGPHGLGKPAEKAMGSFGRITSVADLPAKRTLVALIRRAMKLNEDGVKVPSRSAPRKPIVVRPPAWFMARLRANRKALATWEGFAPSHRRDYLDWVTEAKAEATRERRMATTLEWLAKGKRRNWKYEKR